MREKILAVIEKNSRIDIHDLADSLWGERSRGVANELRRWRKNTLSVVITP